MASYLDRDAFYERDGDYYLIEAVNGNLVSFIGADGVSRRASLDYFTDHFVNTDALLENKYINDDETELWKVFVPAFIKAFNAVTKSIKWRDKETVDVSVHIGNKKPERMQFNDKGACMVRFFYGLSSDEVDGKGKTYNRGEMKLVGSMYDEGRITIQIYPAGESSLLYRTTTLSASMSQLTRGKTLDNKQFAQSVGTVVGQLFASALDYPEIARWTNDPYKKQRQVRRRA